jgi:protein involved in polysaccharide export with SLBB domain
MANKSQFRLAILNGILLVAQPAPAAGFGGLAPQGGVGEINQSTSAAAPGALPIPVGTDQQAEKSLPLEEPIDPEKYICGPGDEFQLNFWGRQNSSFQFLIDPTGRAFVPRVGYVQMADKLLKEASITLHKAVARYYPGLNFDVSLSKPRTFLVHVVGAVAKPGIYRSHATDRVTKVLAEAGGPVLSKPHDTAAGSTRRVEITRRNGQKLPADLLLYDLHGDTANNPYLNDGDIIVVPYESLVVSITGAVQRPGSYELIGTKDIAELVNVAGGLRNSVTRQLPIIVSRRDPANDRLVQIRWPFAQTGELPAFELHNDDQIHVPVADELQRSVMLVGAIQGAVQADEATGIKRMPYEQGDTVRSLIERAGGVGAGADYNGSYIVRMQGKEKAVIPLDLEALLIYRDMQADRPVRIGDIINVPFQRRSIMIEGAVVRPGVYQFNPRLHVQDYIAIAGGASKMAQNPDTYRLVSPLGKTELISEKTTVQPGDTLIVPERHFARAEVTQIVISSIALAVMTTSVAIAASK